VSTSFTMDKHWESGRQDRSIAVGSQAYSPIWINPQQDARAPGHSALANSHLPRGSIPAGARAPSHAHRDREQIAMASRTGVSGRGPPPGQAYNVGVQRHDTAHSDPSAYSGRGEWSYPLPSVIFEEPSTPLSLRAAHSHPQPKRLPASSRGGEHSDWEKVAIDTMEIALNPVVRMPQSQMQNGGHPLELYPRDAAKQPGSALPSFTTGQQAASSAPVSAPKPSVIDKFCMDF
jgi:hypothetical protein